jgi:hypothetical protein
MKGGGGGGRGSLWGESCPRELFSRQQRPDNTTIHEWAPDHAAITSAPVGCGAIFF